VVLIGLLLSATVTAQKSPQQRYIDSLVHLAEQAPPDSTKIILFETIALEYSNLNPKKGLEYGFNANALAKQLGLKNREAASLTVIATNYSAAGELQKGLEYNKRSLEMYRTLKNPRGMAAVNSNLAQDYMKIGDYNQALFFSFEALKQFEDTDQHRNRAIVLDNIADIYYQLRNYSKSKRYSYQALQLYKKYGDDRDIARCLGNVSRAYMDSGEFDKALARLNEALKINKRSGDDASVLINLTNIGLLRMKMYNFDESLSYLRRSLALSEKLESPQYIAINKGNIGTCFVEQYKYEGRKNKALLDSSVLYLSDALQLCDEIAFIGPKPEFLKTQVEAYSLKGDYKKAWELQSGLMTLSDSLNTLSSGDKIAALEVKRELDLRDKDIIIKSRELRIEELKSQRKTIAYVLGILVLLVLFVVVYRYMRRKNRKQTEFISEIKQVQSHDIRGPVATILGLSKMLKQENRSEDSRKELIDGIEKMSLQLNEVLMKVVSDSKKLDNK
jgi:tetratricopeptide (TPR) repeat protein